MQSSEKRIFGYDLIRSIAILLVMVGHVLGYIYSGSFSFFLSFLFGFLGVELFFVLSGILIGGLLIRVFQTENFSQNLRIFLFRRWLRTLPLYFAVLPIYALSNYWLSPVKNTDVSLWKYFFFLQNFFEVQPTFFGVSWSLSVEEWFYLLFAGILFIIKKNQPKISVKHLLLTTVFIFVLVFTMMRFWAFPHYHFTFYEGIRKIAFFRLDAIAYGILAALMMYFLTLNRKKSLLLLMGAFVLLGMNQYQIFRNNYSHLYYFNTIYYSLLGIGLAMIFPYFKQLQIPESFFKKSIVFISKISYSLYLTHWLVFKFAEMPYFSEVPGWGKLIFFFIFSFLLAFCTYHFIEKPVMKLREKLSAKV